MAKQKKARIIRTDKYKLEWYNYQHIGNFAAELARQKDASEIKKIKPKAAPVEMLPVVF